jgi:UDP-2,3-diacylglucosamine pyrophosphatase LpxH
MKHQAIIVSDLHLGTKDSKAEEFIQFLDEHPTDLLILNGDIIDGWALNRGTKWKTIKIIKQNQNNLDKRKP